MVILKEMIFIKLKLNQINYVNRTNSWTEKRF